MNKLWTASALLMSLTLALTNCHKNEEILVPEQGEAYPGGETTFFNTSRNAFGFPAPNLQGMEELQFTTGNSFFNQSWVAAVASTTGRDGLGPLFNEASCASCHFKDGRGRTPQFGERRGHGFLMRLSVMGTNSHGGPAEEPTYGGQLSPMGISGIRSEGDIAIYYRDEQGQYPDGTTYSLRHPTYSISNLGYGPMRSDVLLSPRVANQMVGLGLLEAISQQTIEQLADPYDANGDGISGKANYVYDATTGGQAIGRFGWKAGQPTVRQQVAAAFVGDLGITSELFLNENHTAQQRDCQAMPNGNNAQGYELDDLILDRVDLYSSTLAVPGRRDWDKQDILKGKALFFGIGCQHCHTQKFTTGTHTRFSALSGQLIYPYTDLLLHDMGDDLADGSSEFLASGREWRTAPLWGIGLIETVNGHTELLHDGRARSVEEAILWHGGEAEAIKERFKQLSATDRELIINFIKSL